MAELLLKRDFIMIDVPCTCGFLFMVPKPFDDRKRQTGADFWCPSCGSKLHYGETENAALKRQVKFWEDSYHAERVERAAADQERRRLKGQMTKLKKRVSNGVCPCCNRSFANLRRHMATKHPGYPEKMED
jgi:hypothetical protein